MGLNSLRLACRKMSLKTVTSNYTKQIVNGDNRITR